MVAKTSRTENEEPLCSKSRRVCMLSNVLIKPLYNRAAQRYGKPELLSPPVCLVILTDLGKEGRDAFAVIRGQSALL